MHKALIVIMDLNSIEILNPSSTRLLIDLHLRHYRLGDGLIGKVPYKHEDLCKKAGHDSMYL